MQTSLLKPIYISYTLGSDEDDILQYEEPKIIYSQVTNVTSLVNREDVGYVPEYDRVLIIPYGEESQFVDIETLLWVDVIPNSDKTNSDYKIERVGDVIDGKFMIYCNANVPNTQPIYYLNQKTNIIYQVKVDLVDLVAIVPRNKWLPFDETSKVWLTQPVDSDSTINLVKLKTKELIDNSYKLTFERAV